jgi:hypothetical protein
MERVREALKKLNVFASMRACLLLPRFRGAGSVGGAIEKDVVDHLVEIHRNLLVWLTASDLSLTKLRTIASSAESISTIADTRRCAIPHDALPYLKLSPSTQFVSVELTYREGGVSEIKSFRR